MGHSIRSQSQLRVLLCGRHLEYKPLILLNLTTEIAAPRMRW